MTCANGQLLRFTWYQKQDRQSKKAYETHRRFCKKCRDEFAACDRLARQAATEAWVRLDEEAME